MITQKQVEVLKAISEYIEEKGYGPTNKEIGDILGLIQKNIVNSYINSLEKLGCIKINHSGTRIISITNEGIKLLKLLG